ncbi:MAG TPA: electron transfer flavoprotein subunit beta/FixA family protein [Kouleothrix sp.]|uniref:electron transfer flavoprotein subunit beta/FixA family protein n=1 Tax=Kouleothrix sp. TaxID=2779161 RepID=UPI002C9B2636|nr:electron transfer flavoprotein subunit beta/FixA family protein [Kouleothrix sp.]HRC74792.1 electron transfer flavoprotein subunit beta/FixA family protein [Kouleothrix sp.]
MKQVPRDNSVKINADLSINAEGIEQIMNLFDEYAVEEALQWNEKLGGKVTVLSLGPDEWKDQIRRALAMGATDSLLLNDPSFAKLDVLGAAKAVAAAIKKLGDVDLVIAGRNSTDDESGAFGPALARALGWAQLTYVGKFLDISDSAKKIVVERHLEEQIETVEAGLPVVATVVKDINEPRYPSLLRIKKVAKVEIPTWGAADLGVSADGTAASITARVPPPPRPKGELVEGADGAEKVRKLVDKLMENQVI